MEDKRYPDHDDDQETEFPQKPIVVDQNRRKHDTAILSSRHYLRREAAFPNSGEAAKINENQEIILVIRGMVERVMIKPEQALTLGRSDMRTRFVPDIDLTPYGALDRGVSREHSKLHLEDNLLYITDLESTNGTFLGGKKLPPQVPTLLRKGDELLLGRLAVQILFR